MRLGTTNETNEMRYFDDEVSAKRSLVSGLVGRGTSFLKISTKEKTKRLVRDLVC